MSSLAIERRELVRIAFTECARIQLHLTQCGGCLGWHLPEDPMYPGSAIEHRKCVAMKRILTQWRGTFKAERRMLRMSSPIVGRYETDWFPFIYDRILSRLRALRYLFAEHYDSKLVDQCLAATASLRLAL